ncbi:MAG: acyl-[Muribaculaceae bacterium]|nr:acyl-[acyl-carrier-protein] thioesterase [Muribaculaceae bacterium]MBQ2562230.1 acyl-[acyl-carrier-protein] thioesterase [Muribaculaceae bacterium]MBQ5408664.1 acyl-[acyl-carrier-protein] thioesterase [Muribaculaceae bacterium]MBQ5508163.1 acyl-[acyl-carrier-protein] thioesterase [Muribaculaceae bacterium]
MIPTNPNLKEYQQSFYLSAGECNPQCEMPLTLLVSRVIEVATNHANSWGVGYARLIEDNQGWVLSRVTVEMKRYPRVDEWYTLTTWIEDYNRHFSQRNIEVATSDGEVLGYVRTIWVVINLKTRESVDISKLSYIANNVTFHPCPIEPQSRLRPFVPTRTTSYRFAYCDIDFNGHVNTLRYLEHLMNQFSMQHYNDNFIHRMEIAFVKEAYYDSEAQILIDDNDPMNVRLDINADDATRVRSRFIFQERQ